MYSAQVTVNMQGTFSPDVWIVQDSRLQMGRLIEHYWIRLYISLLGPNSCTVMPPSSHCLPVLRGEAKLQFARKAGARNA